MAMAARVITENYKPRKEMVAFHARKVRFALMVCHRRYGKTVAVMRELRARAMNKPARANAPPRYAYICPHLNQAKDNVWEMLKEMVADIPGMKINNAECSVTFPHNGARIKIYGADNPESLRGGYFDGVVLDEYGDMKSHVWSSVVRPMLGDYKGWAVFIGTPKGKNAFFERRKLAMENKRGNWFYLCVKASESDVLSPEELSDQLDDIGQEDYDREFECSFEVPIKGSYWGHQVNALIADGQVRPLEYDPDYPVHCAWDLGYADATAIWFYQYKAGEYEVIDHYETSNVSLDDICDDIAAKGYMLGTMYLPHDAKAKSVRTGLTIVEQLLAKDLHCKVVDDHKVRDGIEAVRKVLPTLWFDVRNCARGLDHLKAYQREYDPERQVFRDTPKHDAASHSADAMRYLVMSLPNRGKNRTSVKKAALVPVNNGLKQFEPAPAINNAPTNKWTLDVLFEARESEEY